MQDGRIKPSSELGRNQLFDTRQLKVFKRALKNIKPDVKPTAEQSKPDRIVKH
ncbi:hypothetical protein ACVBEF_14690 [Glaciimonas sp. GG7]